MSDLISFPSGHYKGMSVWGGVVAADHNDLMRKDKKTQVLHLFLISVTTEGNYVPQMFFGALWKPP